MSTRRPGLTLAELMIVLLILVGLAAITVPLLTKADYEAQDTVARANLKEVAGAVERYRVDTGRLPQYVRDLFVLPAGAQAYDPFTRRGWNGPYLAGGGTTFPYSDADLTRNFTTAYGTAGDPCVFDGFVYPGGQRFPIVLVTRAISGAQYTWLQSAGPNGILEVPPAPAGPPVPVGNGSQFPGSSSPVDDLTYVFSTR